jgi:diguanylate cyclase (GGDEF)-like protein/PAS domain S-box-containing protein
MTDIQSLSSALGADGFLPHGYCLTWSPGLLSLHVISDLLIVLAYFSIPITLIYFTRKRKDLPFLGLFWVFSLFIVACGTTHLLSAITIWIPLYWLDGIVKAITAIISIVAAVMIYKIIPSALALRSPAQLEAEVQERKLAQAALQESEQRYRIVFDNNPIPLWVIDEQSLRFLMVNNRAVEQYGYSQEEFSRMTLRDIRLKEDIDKLEHIISTTPDRRAVGVWRHRKKDGTIINVEIHTVPMKYGDIPARIALIQDVTRRMKAEAEIRIAATAFESQEGMTVTDAAGIILRVNHAFTEITGYTAEEAIGQNTRMLKSGRHEDSFYTAMWESINSSGAWQGEIWNRRKNGEIYPEHLTITAVKDVEGNVSNYVATQTDITRSKAAEEEIQHLAFYDSLTRLPNRRLLLDRLKQALVSRARSDLTGALLFIDLDNFKTLNDTLGHDIGDLLLKQVAERLESCVREGDTVARLGGDEFVVMLESLSKDSIEAAAQAETVGNKILTTLNRPYQLTTYEYNNSPSIGVTLFNEEHQTIDNLMKQADIAMYQSKKAGRNRLSFFDPQMQLGINSRVELENELRTAILKNEFELYYQIQVNGLHPHRPCGAEALIRWIHPVRGLVAPADFIPLAEDTGLILPIGEWVLETACAQLVQWSTELETAELTIAVNVSAPQFKQVDFADRVLEVIERTGANPQRLKLELTESMLLSDIEGVITKMGILKARGVGFSLDDFGTGYSSLSYLSRLPLDQLKIDQSFVMNLEFNEDAVAISSAIISLAHSLKLKVVAEGIETDAQVYILSSVHRCDCLQGYLFGKPLPIEQFETLLKYG